MEEMEEKVLDNGFVKLIDRMGNDYSILRAARVSTGNEAKKGDAKDRGLIRYLYMNEHMTPFEQTAFTFHLKAPLFVIQQLLRHRTFSFNQASARYKPFEVDVYVPDFWRLQDKKNKQNSIEDVDFNALNKDDINEALDMFYDLYSETYNAFIEEGIAQEQARVVMPAGQYSELFFTVDLRNLLHFLELRLHPHAQKEIRDFAEAILKILNNLDDIKWTMEVFNDVKDLKYLFHAGLKDISGLKKVLEDFSKSITK